MSKYWRIEDGQVCWRTPNADLRGYDYPMLVACLNERDEKIADLEKQLAEKDERIRKLNLEAQRYYEDAYCNDFQDKAKADFAIGQLEKVRNEIDKADKTKSYFKGMEEWSKDKRDYFDLGFSDCQSCIWDVVDWQIHELRGQK